MPAAFATLQSMTNIVKAADAAQFISLIPSMLGYAPKNSVVLIPFADGRTAGGLRMDLPRADGEACFASTAIGLACRVSLVDAVAILIYADAEITTDALPHRDLANLLLASADACGLAVVEVAVITPVGWCTYTETAERPATGHPLPASAPVGGSVDANQFVGADLPAVDFATRERVGRAYEQLGAAVAVCCGESRHPLTDRVDPLALATAVTLDDVPSFFDELLDAPSLDASPYATAALLWCCARPSVRDVGLSTWIGGVEAGDAALEAQLRWEDGEAYPAHIADRVMGEGPRPDWRRLMRALELTKFAAAAAPKAQRPGALSVCAWLSWALGRSTHAGLFAELALEIEPGHGLSGIVLSMAAASHLPAWAFDPDGVNPTT